MSRVDFEVRKADRRPGDPASLVAKADELLKQFDWKPKYDDLSTIVNHALEWESRLAEMKAA